MDLGTLYEEPSNRGYYEPGLSGPGISQPGPLMHPRGLSSVPSGLSPLLQTVHLFIPCALLCIRASAAMEERAANG